jgi:hypothetical protein
VEALANHPGIGVLIVRSAAHGLICVGRNGINYLEEERIEGEDPLAVYGEHAVAAVKRLDAIDHVGDIAVVSFFDPDMQEIAAFEELIGAHGGLGGAQTRPFLLYPADWELDQGPLIGAPMVYQQLRSWMEQKLGMQFGLTKREEAGRTRTTTEDDAAAEAATRADPSDVGMVGGTGQRVTTITAFSTCHAPSMWAPPGADVAPPRAGDHSTWVGGRVALPWLNNQGPGAVGEEGTEGPT